VDEAVTLLAKIDAATGQMERLLDELGAVLGGPAGTPLDLERRPVDLVGLAAAAVAQAQALAPLPVTLDAAVARAPVLGDPSHLGRVLDNLVSNAIKYSPDGGAVVVGVAREDGLAGPRAVLAVTDHGLGIPAADLPHIFERFRRGANVTGRIRGSGVGLASVWQIVDGHGGTVTVASEEGAGATSTVRLPLAPDEHGEGV
jgi:signal transduction histidine kinase